MIKGTYVFYEDGKEICRSENVITKFGKRFLTNYIAGNVSFDNKSMAVGIAGASDYAASDTNSRLGFEFYKSIIDISSIDIQASGGTYSYGVAYKTTLPQDIVGIINEIGIYPGSRLSKNNFDSKFITTFENNYDWFDLNNNTPSLTSVVPARIGSNLMNIDFTGISIASHEYLTTLGSLDLSGYSGNDTLSIAYYRSDTNLSNIKVKFYSSNTDYYYGTFTPTSGTGNKIQEINMSNVFANSSGSPIASSIYKIGVEVNRASTSSACAVYLDALRINDEDTFDPAYGLVSRSTLTSPITKVAGRQLDIEYHLSLGWS